MLNAEYERRANDAETGGRGEAETRPATSKPPSSIRASVLSLQPLPGQPFPGIPNIFNHGVYDHIGRGAGPSVVRGCIFVNCAASGMTQGAGGAIDDCLFIHNGMATDAWTGNETGAITNCVCLGSKQCPAWAAGGGLTLMSKSGRVENNVAAHGSPPQKGAGLMLWSNKGHEAEIPPDASALFRHNVVFDWPADGFYVATTRSRVEFRANCVAKCPQRTIDIIDMSDAQYVFHNNRYEQSNGTFVLKQKPMTFDAFAQAVNETGGKMEEAVHFPDPNRTIESYAKSIGLESRLDAFMAAADAQARYHWDDQLTAAAVNDYIRQGFGITRQ